MLEYLSMEQQKKEQSGSARRFDQVFEPYRSAFILGDLQQQEFIMNELVSNLLSRESTRLSHERGRCNKPDKQTSMLQDLFTCILCQKLFHVPVTLICGHTFCLECLGIYQGEERTVCPDCGQESKLKYSANIAVRELIRKYFPEKAHIRSCSEETGRLLKERRIEESMQRLQTLLVQYPENTDLLYLRSRGYKCMNRYREALKDMDLAYSLNPYHGDISYERGVLLASLDEPEEAVNMFVRASVLKPNDTTFRHSLTTYLESIFRKTCDSSHQSHSDVFDTRDSRCNKVLKGVKISYEQDIEEFSTTVRSKKQVCRESQFESRRTNTTRTFTEPLANSQGNIRSEEICKSNSRKLDKDNLCNKADEDEGENISQNQEQSCGVSCVQGNVIEPSKLSTPTELECKLCFNLMYDPVTTPCGHSFCRCCLKRCLDHRFECPCCRASLHKYLEHLIMGNIGSCHVLERILLLKFNNEYEARRACYEKELFEFSRCESNKDEIPIFVCTLAVPGIACPLHIFEPRYKLMIRRCLESGSRQFGMCLQDPEHGFSSVGTMLYINDVNFLPDGRSIVHTVGSRRFEVLERSLRDGYNCAKVLWLEDDLNETDYTELNYEVYKMMVQWFNKLPIEQQGCIVKAVGPIPDANQRTEKDGPSWLWWLLLAMPLNSDAKRIILSMNSVTERLSSSKRFLAILLSKL